MNKSEYVSPNKSVKIRNLKYDNQRAVLSCLQHFEVLSVSDLSEMVHLSKTTIAKMLYSLADKQIVSSVGKGSSTREGGKKPELFSFNSDFKYSLVIMLHLDYIDLAVLDLNSKVRFRLSNSDRKFTTYESAIDLMAESINEIMDQNHLNPTRIYSISISSEGIIDAEKGLLRFPIHHSWPRNLPIADDLKAKLPFSPNAVFLDSPPNFMGYSELLSPINANLYKIVYIYSDEACGGSIIKERKIMHGANGFVGEFGHIVLNPDSKIKCTCGGTGCFESLVSVKTLLADAVRTSGREKLTLDEFLDDFRRGAPYALEVIGKVTRWFSLLIHNMILAHDPDKIIIQGAYIGAGDRFLEILREQINALPFYKIKRNIAIEFASRGAIDSTFAGAAHHSCNHFLQALDILD